MHVNFFNSLSDMRKREKHSHPKEGDNSFALLNWLAAQNHLTAGSSSMNILRVTMPAVLIIYATPAIANECVIGMIKDC